MIDLARDSLGPLLKPKNSGKQMRTLQEPPRFILSILVMGLLIALLPECIFDFAHIGGQECSKPDLITGFIHLKKKLITWKQEGFSSGITNTSGFVDYEHKREKPSGVCRIAMLGDSMTEALQVPQEKRSSNLLEHRLNTLYPGKFEVFNFGVSAAGTGQEYLTYLRYVEDFKPDITMLFFDNGDEDKNARKPEMAPWHPHVVFSLEKKGNLVASWRDFDAWLHSAPAIPIALFEANRSQSHAWGALIQEANSIKTDSVFASFCAILDRLRLLDPLEDCLTTLLPVSRFGPSEFRMPQLQIDSERKEFCSNHGIIYADPLGAPLPRFNEHDFEFGREAIYHTRHLSSEQIEGLRKTDRERWELTLAILRRLSSECRRTGSKLIVFGFPALRDKEGFDSAFSRITGIADQQYTYAQNLTPAFDLATQTKASSPRIVGHLSATGHEVTAELLFDFLVQHKLLSKWTQSPSIPALAKRF